MLCASTCGIRDNSLNSALAARKLYEEALRIDPRSAPALIHGLG